MEGLHKWWSDRFAFIPFAGLCLILPGMQAAICTALGADRIPYWESIGIYCVVSLLIVFFVRLPERWLWKAAIVLALGTGFYVWKNWQLILEHAGVMATYINKKYEIYTGVKLLPEEWCLAGSLRNNIVIMLFCIISGLCIAWITLKLRSKILMVMPVILLYCGALLLGVTPGQTATLVLVIGIAIEMLWISEQQRSRNSVRFQIKKMGRIGSAKRICIMALILMVGLGVSWHLTSRVSKTVFRDVTRIQIRQHKMELELQTMVETKGQQLRGMLGIDGGGYLSNVAPKYRNQKVFDVTVSEKPSDSMYLRGFVGDMYQGGKWKASNKIHKVNGRRKKGVWKGKYNSSSYTFFRSEEQDVEIHYTKLGSRSKYLYIPYCQNGEMNEMSREERDLCLGKKDDELPLYQGLVDEIEADTLELGDELVMDVQSILWGNASYSMDLDPVPPNRDYAENFLFYSQKGYCEHFATAGTLILRKMNHVARYVSGYRISPGRFMKNADGTYTAGVLDSDAHAWSEVWVDGEYWMPQEMTPPGADAGESGGVREMEPEEYSEENPVEIVTPTRPPAAELSRKTEEPQKTEEQQETEKPEEEEETKAPSQDLGTGAGQMGGNGSDSGSGFDVREKKLQKWWQGLAKWQKILLESAGAVIFFLMLIAGIRYVRMRRRLRHMAQLRGRNRNGYIRMRLGLFLDRLHHSGIAVCTAMPEQQWMQVLEETLPEQIDGAELAKAAELIRRAAYSREIVTDGEAGWFDAYCEKIEAGLAGRFRKFTRKLSYQKISREH